MKEEEKRATELVHSTDELRKVLLKYPGLPLVIFAGEGYAACSKAIGCEGIILDCMQEVDKEKVYIDRAEFEEDLYNKLYNYYDGSDDDFEVYFKDRLKEYEPYWKDAFILFVNK